MKASSQAMLNFDQAEFFYDPYPIGRARKVVAPDVYREMLATFPPIELFNHVKKAKDDKYYLNEVKTRDRYLPFIAKTPVWREFHRWVKSAAFVPHVFGMLDRHTVKLGIATKAPPFYRQLRQVASDLKHKRYPRFFRKPYVRFEFSALPADGGFIQPHTDAPDKIVTLVVSMVDEGEWDTGWGGGLEVDRAKDVTRSFNHANRHLTFDEVEPVRIFDFVPNQCVIFVKTFNSLHCVRPMMLKGSQRLRKTLTINIEYE
jgi:hypothetical protein